MQSIAAVGSWTKVRAELQPSSYSLLAPRALYFLRFALTCSCPSSFAVPVQSCCCIRPRRSTIINCRHALPRATRVEVRRIWRGGRWLCWRFLQLHDCNQCLTSFYCVNCQAAEWGCSKFWAEDFWYTLKRSVVLEVEYITPFACIPRV